jgi:hypothetical protein
VLINCKIMRLIYAFGWFWWKNKYKLKLQQLFLKTEIFGQCGCYSFGVF